ncbi:DUF3291 domain-containing protein [Thiolinea disciformis]|uniref:DUF3291 domain-containing protein n=1 Tax=Thiolinea disciformis TaxID=125614 RepID=UPI000373100F|nr:DUF3291 domain-containing protein [Thiolinea disciformis]
MKYQLAQLNIATLLAPLDSPELKDFVDNLDRINALAEQSQGFVWRLQTAAGDATALRPFGEDVIVNLSVWDSVEALHQFVYRSAHAPIMSRRREWFARMAQAYMVLWWVPTGHQPSVEEAKQRLEQLQTQEPSAEAFTFKKLFPPEALDASF